MTDNRRSVLSVRLALGALIVKEKKKILYEELLEDIRESPYNESQDLKTQIEGYKARYGHYPEAVCADKIYRTRENLRQCHEYGIRLSGPKLGRLFKESEKNIAILRERQRIEREDESTRIAVEGKFGEGKRRYSLDCVETKLRETTESAIRLVFLVMNLMVLYRRKAKAFFAALLDTLVQMIRRAF